MEFKNNPIAEQVEQQMNELRKKGVDFTIKNEHGYDGSMYNRVYEAFYTLFKKQEQITNAAKAILSETMFFEVGSEGEHFEDSDTYKNLEEMINFKNKQPLREVGSYICVANNSIGVYASDICGGVDTASESAKETVENFGGTCEVFAKRLETGSMESILKFPLPKVLEEVE